MEEHVRIIAGGFGFDFCISFRSIAGFAAVCRLVGINLIRSAFTHWCLIEKPSRN